MAKHQKNLIIGIDPGTSASVAIFDLDGKFIAAETIRNPGKERIIEEILKYGVPIVVATDVRPPPESVAQIASNFNARLFVPERDMLQRDKEELASEIESIHKVKLNSTHEKDAAASAMHFFKYYKNKMAWIERNITEKGLSEFGTEIKTYILQGVPLSRVVDYVTIKEEIKDETENQKKERKETRESREAKIKEKKEELMAVKELMESNAKLRSLLSIVSAENKTLNERIREIEKEFYSGMKTDKILKSKEMQINRLKALLKRQMHEISRLEQSLKMQKNNSKIE